MSLKCLIHFGLELWTLDHEDHDKEESLGEMIKIKAEQNT